jgi:hypothetical protein
MILKHCLFYIFAAVLVVLLNPALAQEQNLGTSFGIPNSSPGVFWPRSFSVESLGFGRLYPNGPEFGLGNTSGGFGVAAGRYSGVGLAERSVPGFVQEQLDRPYANTQHLVDLFNEQSGSSKILLSALLSGQFRGEIQRGSVAQRFDIIGADQPASLYALPSVDFVLRDRAQSSDAILQTGF